MTTSDLTTSTLTGTDPTDVTSGVPGAGDPTALTGVAAVAAIYEAFGRRDVPTVLSMLADDVTWDGDWVDNWAQRTRLELLTPRYGHAGVTEFFDAVSRYTVHHVAVLDLLSSDRQVVAEVVIELEAPDGGRYRDEELHLWRFGPDGKVVALRHYVDTAKHLAAGRGEDTTRR
jgi:ketosteroid isomerase-like protein